MKIGFIINCMISLLLVTDKHNDGLYGVPELIPTNIVEGREQRVWKMAPSPTRKRDRSETYQGIANAMAEQWG